MPKVNVRKLSGVARIRGRINNYKFDRNKLTNRINTLNKRRNRLNNRIEGLTSKLVRYRLAKKLEKMPLSKQKKLLSDSDSADNH